MKTLKQVYRTYEGARNRAGFENVIAHFDYEHGYKARYYHYTIIQEGDTWRVQRSLANTAKI